MSPRSVLAAALILAGLSACAPPPPGGYSAWGASATLDTSRGLTTRTVREEGVIESEQDEFPEDSFEEPDPELPRTRRR
jgi:hypothetical protein